MASIVMDGPREWATDVVDRKLGRLAGMLTGVAMLVAVVVIQPGPARFALAVGSVILIARSTRAPATSSEPQAQTCPDPDIVERVAELETALFNLQAWGKTRAAFTQERLELITGMVAEVADQVR